jgi:hypothetical protein
MKIDAQQIIDFIIKWFCTGLVLYFGLMAGQWIDRFIPNPPA